MSRNKPRKPILIREDGGIRTFRDPETGEEFSVTVSTPIREMKRDSSLYSVKCIIRSDQEITNQLATLRSVIGAHANISNRQMLADARTKRAVTISGFRIWKAEQIVEALLEHGLTAEVILE